MTEPGKIVQIISDGGVHCTERHTSVIAWGLDEHGNVWPLVQDGTVAGETGPLLIHRGYCLTRDT